MVAAAPQNGATRKQVTIEGWSPKGGESVIYQAIDLRIILVTVLRNALSARTVLEQQQDSYGTTWEHVKVSAWVAESDVVPDVSTVWAAAQKLYAARCSGCHALRAPGDFTANQWPGIVRSMAKNAAFDSGQVALVTPSASVSGRIAEWSAHRL